MARSLKIELPGALYHISPGIRVPVLSFKYLLELKKVTIKKVDKNRNSESPGDRNVI
jgi:hypothetical protein